MAPTESKIVTKNVKQDSTPGTKVSETLSLTKEDLSTIISSVVGEVLKGTKSNQNQQPSAQNSQDVMRNVQTRMNSAFDAVEKRNRDFLHSLAKWPKERYVSVRIPRVYRRYFGSTLPLGLSGSVIYVPVDGMPHAIPDVFVPLLERKLSYEDEKIDFMERTGKADISETTRDNLK